MRVPPAIPTFNGVETELFQLREGYGISLTVMEKINGCRHLLSCLGVEAEAGEEPRDRAFRAREAFIKFIADCAGVKDDVEALSIIFNLDTTAAYYNKKINPRRLDLEQVFKVGRRKVRSREADLISVLARELFQAAKARS